MDGLRRFVGIIPIILKPTAIDERLRLPLNLLNNTYEKVDLPLSIDNLLDLG